MAQGRGSVLSGLWLEGDDKGAGSGNSPFRERTRVGVQIREGGWEAWDFPNKFPGSGWHKTLDPWRYDLKKHKKQKTNMLNMYEREAGSSLVVQWLELCAFTAKGMGSIPGQGTNIIEAA